MTRIDTAASVVASGQVMALAFSRLQVLMLNILRSRATLIWLMLVTATLISWSMNEGLGFSNHRIASVAVILIAFFKIFFVMMDFMELRGAPLFMRAIAGTWITVVGTTLCSLFWLGTDPAVQAVWPHINGL